MLWLDQKRRRRQWPEGSRPGWYRCARAVGGAKDTVQAQAFSNLPRQTSTDTLINQRFRQLPTVQSGWDFGLPRQAQLA
jgi:hypothetical protein